MGEPQHARLKSWQSLDAPPAIERRGGLSYAEFRDSYMRPWRPLILLDATAHWRALKNWTPEFFREQYRAHAVEIDTKSYAMAEFIDLVAHSTAENPAPYWRNRPMRREFSELMGDISPMPPYTFPNWFESRLFPDREAAVDNVEIYIGGTGARFPVLHFDNYHSHAFLYQVYGEKEYVLYSPDQTPFLYPGEKGNYNRSSIDDLEKPDLKRFPEFARAVPVKLRLSAGESLFVPAGWWHTARVLSPSITVSINTVNATNWWSFVRDYSEMVRRHRSRPREIAMACYLTAMGLVEASCDLMSLSWVMRRPGGRPELRAGG